MTKIFKKALIFYKKFMYNSISFSNEFFILIFKGIFMQTTTEKKVITIEEFEKKVEIEAAHLEYFNRLNRAESRRQAREVISEDYVVSTKTT